MAKGSFGERLKREREMRGVSLEEVSAATRISTRFLAALETEQWDRLPGGIFNRGFVRAVAHYLGLDEEALIAEYAAATNDRPAFAVTAKSLPKSRRPARPWLALLAVVALAAAGWLAYRGYVAALHRRVQGAANGRASAPAGRATTSTLPTFPASTPAGSPASAEAPPAGPASSPAAAPMSLRIEVGRTTHLSVAADGKTVFDGEVKPGEGRTYQAGKQFQVSAGDSSAVLLKLNGYNLPPLGPPDQPGSATFTRDDLKKLEPRPL
jgi:cytoskeleton protein RodZ